MQGGWVGDAHGSVEESRVLLLFQNGIFKYLGLFLYVQLMN